MSTTEGQLVDYQRYRIQALWVVAVVSLLMLLFVGPKAASNGLAHELIEYVGRALIMSAVLGRTWSTLYLGGRKLSEIVDTGPYSIVRNPLYVFSLIGVFGIGLETSSVTLAFILLAMVAVVFHIITRQEESALRLKFGAPFEEYCARVPRMIPKFSLWRNNDKILVSPSRVVSTFFDSSMMFLAIPICEGVEWLQLHNYVPVLLHLP